MNEKESDIQNAICEYLAVRRYWFWRSNNVPVFDRTKGIFRAMPKYAIKGLPDIQIISSKGLPIFLEVKRSGGSLSSGQREFQRRCAERGVEYHVVRSLDDVRHIGL